MNSHDENEYENQRESSQDTQKVSIKIERHRWPDEIEAEKKKRNKNLIVIASIVVAFVIGTQFGKITSFANAGNSSKGVEHFERVYRDLLNNWYFTSEMENPESEMIDNAIKGMLTNNGDMHTTYMTTAEMKQLNDSINRNFEGIGVQFYSGDNANIITRVFKDSPAEKAGIVAGDIIQKVDGVDISTGTNDVKSLIQGSDGTQVKVEVLRGNDVLSFDMKRAKINALAYGEVLDGNIGYLEITSFGRQLGEVTKSYLNDFKAQGVDSLIIDLRDNGGGYLQAVNELASLFFENNAVVYSESFKTGSDKEYVVSNSEASAYKFKKITLLINEKSASASEVLALALKENLDVEIVGVNSYGKGTVQTQHDYKDDSALKVTIAKWNSPNGNNIHGVGIAPDYEVLLPNIFYRSFYIFKDNEPAVHQDEVHPVVAYAQDALTFLGYHTGRTDGYYDKETEASLKNFKASKGLPVDDSIDSTVEESLYASVVAEWAQNKKTHDAQLHKAIEVTKNGQ